ncbi:MAG: hypothetical protein ACXVP0_04285 [Bacteroidia bacterium]
MNTITGVYGIRLQRLASVWFIIEDRMLIETRILGFRRRAAMTLYQQDKPATPKKEAPSKPLPAARLMNVLRSFKINTCHITLDTGDMQLNGLLYPLFKWVSWSSGKDLRICFSGHTEIVIEIKNSIARMSRAYLNATYKPIKTKDK